MKKLYTKLLLIFIYSTFAISQEELNEKREEALRGFFIGTKIIKKSFRNP